MLKRLLIISSLAVATIGCSSTPEPVDLTQSSQAYKAVYGTYLTEPYEYGFKTYRSNLRDFAQSEASESKKVFEQSNGGDLSMLFGGIALLTGDLTGAIDVAGGAAANIASSNHPSARSGWVAKVNVSKASDGVEAKQVATNVIQTATLELLRSKGNKVEKVVMKPASVATFGAKIPPKTAYQINDIAVFGMTTDHFYDDKKGFELNKSKTAYVPTGDTLWFGVNVANYMAFEKGYVKGYGGIEGYEQFMKDLTALLPSDYFYYSSPVPTQQLIENKYQSQWSCDDCLEKGSFFLQSQPIPVVFRSGQLLEFIKP